MCAKYLVFLINDLEVIWAHEYSEDLNNLKNPNQPNNPTPVTQRAEYEIKNWTY